MLSLVRKQFKWALRRHSIQTLKRCLLSNLSLQTQQVLAVSWSEGSESVLIFWAAMLWRVVRGAILAGILCRVARGWIFAGFTDFTVFFFTLPVFLTIRILAAFASFLFALASCSLRNAFLLFYSHHALLQLFELISCHESPKEQPISTILSPIVAFYAYNYEPFCWKQLKTISIHMEWALETSRNVFTASVISKHVSTLWNGVAIFAPPLHFDFKTWYHKKILISHKNAYYHSIQRVLISQNPFWIIISLQKWIL